MKAKKKEKAKYRLPENAKAEGWHHDERAEAERVENTRDWRQALPHWPLK